MSSNRHGHVGPPRPATKARQDKSASTVPVPVPVKAESRHPRKPHGKKHPAPMASSPESRETPRRPRSHRQPDDFSSMGAWCGDIPERHYTPRISIGEGRRAQRLPAAPTPPSVTPPRLSSPRPPLAFDAEFGEDQLDEDERVGDAWYLSRRTKTNWQCELLPSRLVSLLVSIRIASLAGNDPRLEGGGG